MQLINIETGKLLQIGDKVKTFRGETGTLTGYDPPRHAASTGKVYVELHGSDRTYFPSVIGAKLIEGDGK